MKTLEVFIKPLLLYLCVHLIMSCEMQSVPLKDPTINNDVEVVLYERLSNPYSVENMTNAYNSIKGAHTKSNSIVVDTTHIHVKFKLRNPNELDLLKQDTTLNLYPYPLDCDISLEGFVETYEVGREFPTYYASVPFGVVIPDGIEYEILDYLFIPEELGEDVDCIPSELLDLLVETSFSLTGNERLPQTKSSEWYPSGKITAYDDRAKKQIPLQGVKVRARRWFTTHVCYTNAAGIYKSSESFKDPANYSIVWEDNSYWDIRNGGLGQATFDGPKQSGPWNLAIDSSTDDGLGLGFATLHRAAYRYYYKNIGGLARPANAKKEKICFMDKSGTGSFWGNIGLGVLPDVKVFRKHDNGNVKTTDVLFRTTTHELGHVSHCTWMNQIQYWQVDKIIYESWADFVEFAITEIEYNELGVSVPLESHQSWPNVSGDLAYSSLFIDLVDTYNQGATNSSLPYDELFGYSYNNLNVILLDIYDLISLKASLKLWKPYNITDDQIDKFMEVYENTDWKN